MKNIKNQNYVDNNNLKKKEKKKTPSPGHFGAYG